MARLTLALALLTACSKAPSGADSGADSGAPGPADLRVVGTIHLGGGATTDALAVADGVVVATGAEALEREALEVVEVPEGGAAVPGLHDAHTHTLAGSFVMEHILLQTASSMTRVQEAVAGYAEEHPDEPWIIGFGWTPELLGAPDGRELDAVAPDRPVALVAGSGHAVLVNSAALARAGITADTPDPAGGEIVRDPETGAPTGLLREGAMALVVPLALADYDDASLSASLQETLDEMVAGGLTAITEILAAPGVDLSRPWLYTELDAAGELDLRVHYMLPVNGAADLAGIAEACAAHQSPRVRCVGGKLWVDGSIASHEGWTFDAWSSTGEHGTASFDEAELVEILTEAEAQGLPLRIHAMGDAAIDAALSALEAVAASQGLEQPHALDHVVLADAGLRARMAALGVAASVQPAHRLGAQASGWHAELESWDFDATYPFGALRDAGVPLALGTDWPAWPVHDPTVTLWAAATDPRPDALSALEALDGMSAGAARAAGLGADHGCLDVGCAADLVVFDADPATLPADDLSNLQVEASFVGGERVR